jgi:hypothetical protein
MNPELSQHSDLFVNSKEYIRLAPWNARKGDIISVLFGGVTPFVLRKISSQNITT